MIQASRSLVEVPRTARYYRLNSVTPKTKNIWIVFHGYGQLAKYFIRHFDELDPEEHHIIAVEGLSRFYLDGLSGRVGASWMTKEDRELEIRDQSTYLNAVLRDCNIDPTDKGTGLIVLGFSQGTATAIRWLVNNGIRPEQLILWAGSFPHDVDAAQHPALFQELLVHYVHGDDDPFLKDVDIAEKLRLFDAAGMHIRHWQFEGKHVMHKPTLAKIVGSFGSGEHQRTL